MPETPGNTPCPNTVTIFGGPGQQLCLADGLNDLRKNAWWKRVDAIHIPAGFSAELHAHNNQGFAGGHEFDGPATFKMRDAGSPYWEPNGGFSWLSEVIVRNERSQYLQAQQQEKQQLDQIATLQQAINASRGNLQQQLANPRPVYPSPGASYLDAQALQQLQQQQQAAAYQQQQPQAYASPYQQQPQAYAQPYAQPQPYPQQTYAQQPYAQQFYGTEAPTMDDTQAAAAPQIRHKMRAQTMPTPTAEKPIVAMIPLDGNGRPLGAPVPLNPLAALGLMGMLPDPLTLAERGHYQTLGGLGRFAMDMATSDTLRPAPTPALMGLGQLGGAGPAAELAKTVADLAGTTIKEARAALSTAVAELARQDGISTRAAWKKLHELGAKTLLQRLGLKAATSAASAAAAAQLGVPLQIARDARLVTAAELAAMEANEAAARASLKKGGAVGGKSLMQRLVGKRLAGPLSALGRWGLNAYLLYQVPEALSNIADLVTSMMNASEVASEVEADRVRRMNASHDLAVRSAERRRANVYRQVEQMFGDAMAGGDAPQAAANHNWRAVTLAGIDSPASSDLAKRAAKMGAGTDPRISHMLAGLAAVGLEVMERRGLTKQTSTPEAQQEVASAIAAKGAASHADDAIGAALVARGVANEAERRGQANARTLRNVAHDMMNAAVALDSLGALASADVSAAISPRTSLPTTTEYELGCACSRFLPEPVAELARATAFGGFDERDSGPATLHAAGLAFGGELGFIEALQQFLPDDVNKFVQNVATTVQNVARGADNVFSQLQADPVGRPLIDAGRLAIEQVARTTNEMQALNNSLARQRADLDQLQAKQQQFQQQLNSGRIDVATQEQLRAGLAAMQAESQRRGAEFERRLADLENARRKLDEQAEAAAPVLQAARTQADLAARQENTRMELVRAQAGEGLVRGQVVALSPTEYRDMLRKTEQAEQAAKTLQATAEALTRAREKDAETITGLKVSEARMRAQLQDLETQLADAERDNEVRTRVEAERSELLQRFEALRQTFASEIQRIRDTTREAVATASNVSNQSGVSLMFDFLGRMVNAMRQVKDVSQTSEFLQYFPQVMQQLRTAQQLAQPNAPEVNVTVPTPNVQVAPAAVSFQLDPSMFAHAPSASSGGSSSNSGGGSSSQVNGYGGYGGHGQRVTIGYVPAGSAKAKAG